MITEVNIHCSDSKFGNAAMIDGWHFERGFDNGKGHHIGYHLVILNGWTAKGKYNSRFDGHTETGRAFDDDSTLELDEKAAAVLGHNMSINICMIGKSGKFTDNQLNTLMYEIFLLKIQFEKIKVFQHSDHDSKKPHCAGLSNHFIKYLNS